MKNFFHIALHFIARFWFYLAIISALLLGWLAPVIGQKMNNVGVLPYLVALAFFLNGFTLSVDALFGSIRQWRILLAGAILVFVVSPGAMLLIRMCLHGGHSPLGQGFQLLSLVPTMLVSAVVLTRTARGNGALALCLTVFSNLLAILIIPSLIALTFGSSGFKLNIADTSVNLVITVLLPTVIGQIVRLCRPAWALRHARSVAVLSQCTILIFILIGLAALPHEHMSGHIWVIVLTGVLAFRLLLLCFGWLTGIALNIDVAARKALTFCSSEKSMVFVILLWERLYAHLGVKYGIVVLPGILFYIIELITDSVLAQWWGHRVDDEEIGLGT